MNAGRLSNRLRFQSQAQTVMDEYGNATGAWTDAFTVWAEMLTKPGSEAVMAARLDGRQPVSARVRLSPATQNIGTDWRAIGEDGTVYNVRAAAPDLVTRAWVFLLLEAGVAT